MNTFGEAITEKALTKGLTLRSLWKKLEVAGSKISSSKLSKIMRGIQNPKDQAEFNEIMQALEVTDSQELKNLETLAMNFIPPQPLSDEEFIKSLPITIGKTFNSQEEIDDFIKSWRSIMEADKEPDLE